MTESRDNQKMLVHAVYILYALSLFSGITALAAVVIAHVFHNRSEPPWQEHFRYQYRTFWIGLLYTVVAASLVPIGLGILLLLAVAVWFVVRIVRGLIGAINAEEIPDPETWLV